MKLTDNFNSHAHVERDENRLSAPFDVNISTHMLTWSVTGAKLDDNAVIGISTHTLTWSVTRLWQGSPASCLNFNSHAHVERDYCSGVILPLSAISTHTLTWSVTYVLFGF